MRSCSVCGVMLCWLNWPNVGLSPSSSLVKLIIADMVAFHLSMRSAFSLRPTTYFCG